MERSGGTTEAGSNSNWAELTMEILLNILARLSLSERWTGPMFVCKPWLHACKDSSLNSVIDLEDQFKSSSESAHLWSPEFERKIDAMLRTVVNWTEEGSVTEIRLRHCPDFSLPFIAERCPNLQVLSIKTSPNVTDASMAFIASGCPNLRELDISSCYGISHKTLAVIGKNCPKLKILRRSHLNWLDPSENVGLVPNEYMYNCPKDTDTEAAAIAKYMPNLEVLELRFSELGDRGLSLITKGCLNLEYLDLSGFANLTTSNISEATSSLKKLKKLERPIPITIYYTEKYSRRYGDRLEMGNF